MAGAPDNFPKAVVSDYSPAPFFYAQTSPSGAVRWVAWSEDVRQTQRLVYDVLRLFSPHALVLLKVDKQDVPDGPVWTRYHGDAPLAKVVEAIRANEPFVFQDGYTQLCVRDDDTEEYIALDEYGLLWIYADDGRFAEVCRKNGFEERPEELISDRGHYRRTSPDSEEQRERFLSALNLQEVE